MATSLGGGATADALATELLDATGATPIYSGVFNGAVSQDWEAACFSTRWAGKTELNSLLGVTAADGNAAILADLAQGFRSRFRFGVHAAHGDWSSTLTRI